MLAVQFKVTECVIGCAPVPDKLIETGEFAALLATVALPVMFPVAAGVKLTLNSTACPGDRIRPAETPVAVKPGPEMVTFAIVMLELPEFVKVTPNVLVLPELTLPKLKADVLTVSAPATALTVSVAAALVTLPAELLTVTVNCAPLSAPAVAGVV